MIGGWTDLLVRGRVPDATLWIGAGAWAVVAFVVGGSFFMSWEGEFAVWL